MKKPVTSYEQLLENINKNVDYWAYYVSVRSSHLKCDASQELHIMVWKLYNKFLKEGKETTIYYFQKRLFYMSSRIIKQDRAKHTIKINGKVERVIFNNIEDVSPHIIESLSREEEKNEELEWIKKVFTSTLGDLKNNLKEKDEKILNLMMNGTKNKEIAQQFGMKENALSIRITRNIKNPLKQMMFAKGDSYESSGYNENSRIKVGQF